MASLISWLDDERKKVQHTIGTAASSVYHGLNLNDNGQGWTSQKPQNPSPASNWNVNRVVHDVTHNPVTNTIGNDVIKPVVHHAAPIFNFPQTFNNDILKPINRDVIQPVGGAIADTLNKKSPAMIPTVKGVGLGIGRAAVGLGQAASGLYDLATPGTGTNRFSKDLTQWGANIDKVAKQQHVNPVVYHGTQIGANLLGPAELKTVAKAPEAIRPAVNAVERVPQFVERATSDLFNKGAKGRIAAKTIRGATNPKLAAANAGYQTYNIGQQAAQGHDINPAAEAATYAAFQAGLPLAGAVGREAIQPVVNGVRNTVLPEVATGMQNLIGAPASHINYNLLPTRTGGTRLRITPESAPSVIAANTVKGAGDIKTLAQEFNYNHPVGLSARNVDTEGNILNMGGKPTGFKVGTDGKVTKVDPQIALKQRAKPSTALPADVQELITATKQAAKAGDIDQARSLADSLEGAVPDDVVSRLHKEIDTRQQKYEQDILDSVLQDTPEPTTGSTDSADATMSRVAKKLADHFNGRRSLYKITGAKRTYETPSGRLTVGGDAKSAIDNLINTGDITTFYKNINILADKFGGTFNDVRDIIKTSAPDGADYERFVNDFNRQLSKRPRYSRRSGTATQDSADRQPIAKSERDQAAGGNRQSSLKATNLSDALEKERVKIPQKVAPQERDQVTHATGINDGSQSVAQSSTTQLTKELPASQSSHAPASRSRRIDSNLQQSKGTQKALPRSLSSSKASSSTRLSSSRGGVSNARPALVRGLPSEAHSGSQLKQVASHDLGRENIPSPAEPSQSALKGSRSPSESRIQSQPQTPRKQAQNQVSGRKQSQLATNSEKSYPQHTRARGFAQSVKESNEVSSEVQKRSGGSYQTRNTQKMVDKSEARAKNNLPSAVDSTLSALNRKKGTITDQEVSDAISTAKRLDANKNYAQATEIYDKLDDHLREHGRAVQAASVLNRRTPEGLRYSAFAELKKHGVNVTPEFERAMFKKIEDIKNTKPGTLERDLNIKQLQKLVNKQIPSDLADKLTGTWKAGLLTGIRTQSGNALSNETFSVLHNLSNLLAAPLDKVASLVTGTRTKALTGRGLVSGTKEGFDQGFKYLKTGIDERSPLENKFSQSSRELNFKNRALNVYVNGVFRLMGAADRPHYYRQLRNSLYDLGKTDGMNKGLKGQVLRDHINEFVKNPPVEQFQRATHEAEQAVLANDTLLSHAAGKIQKLADEAKSPVGKFFAKVAIHGIAPFTKVPSAFLSRVIDYTPAGAVKEAIVQASKKQFDQRSLVTAIAESTTGTGLVLLGAALAQSGQLSGNYPNDPKEQQRWKAQGIQPNSIKLGNTWVSMNYLGPVGMLFGAGARMNDVKTEKGTLGQQAIAAASGLPKDLTEQSFLQGLNNAVSAINEPDRYASSFAKSQIGSVIPTLVNDVATATDNKQRQSDTVPDRIKSRIPGLRETLPVAQDVYGNELKRKTGPISSMVNPFRPSDAITNSVKMEVERLHKADPNNSDLQVTPTPVDRMVSIEGKKVPLTNKQRYDLQKQIGQTTQSLWGQLIKTSGYKSLSDIDKAKALNNLRSDATTLATRTFVVNNKLGAYSKVASSKVAALGDGSANVAGYATNADSETNVSNAAYYKTPDAEYKAFQATYNQNIKDGSYDAAQKITASKKLAKLKVGSKYPKEVRDLYGLSKADLTTYLKAPEKGIDKQDIAKRLMAYDQALYNAGLISYRKFKNGIAPAAKSGSGGGSSKSKAAAGALLRSELRQLRPLTVVGSLPAPTKTAAPTFKLPALRTVYHREPINRPQSSITRPRRLA